MRNGTTVMAFSLILCCEGHDLLQSLQSQRASNRLSDRLSETRRSPAQAMERLI
ncbi:hypothetical protein CDEST_05675 [Colletotrichum destructivum]|uniref:Uncharacterized protein n=1 Tax=Colletotrichum destructivum TaxID=34406 RepID=A0AAX4IBC1_9PEZI|nr:hypothetical protein CDEST_05675 [Colletotrichum destructivum]